MPLDIAAVNRRPDSQPVRDKPFYVLAEQSLPFEAEDAILRAARLPLATRAARNELTAMVGASEYCWRDDPTLRSVDGNRAGDDSIVSRSAPTGRTASRLPSDSKTAG